jgi:hypothetical protein
MYKGILRVAEISPTIAQGVERPRLMRPMEFESSEGDHKENLLKVQDMKKQGK